MKPSDFVIHTNAYGIRVLLIGPNQVQNINIPEYDQFDALLYQTDDDHIAEHQYLVFHPALEPACYFKPLFFHPRVTDKNIRALCDGFVESPDSELLSVRTEEIRRHQLKLGFEISREPLPDGNRHVLFALFRLMLSRSDVFPDYQLDAGSPWGYAIPVVNVLIKNNYVQAEVVAELMSDMIAKYHYLESYEMVDTVHVCPVCYRSHLIFTEICPKCHRPDIREEDVIHHFPCANISPEATYLSGQGLRCPKCRKELRHIGIDYDRPMGLYTCYSCNLSFTQPAMRVTCVSCSRVSLPKDLKAVQLHRLRFTPLGIRVFSHAHLPLAQNDQSFLPILQTYNVMVDYIRSKVSMPGASPLIVMRFAELLDKEEVSSTAFRSLEQFPEAIAAFNRHTLFVVLIGVSETRVNELIGLIAQGKKADFIAYQASMRPDEFIRYLI